MAGDQPAEGGGSTGTGESGGGEGTSGSGSTEGGESGSEMGEPDLPEEPDPFECPYGAAIVLPEETHFESEAELEVLEGIACIEGSLSIALDDIADLGALADLRKVTGFVSLTCLASCEADLGPIGVREAGYLSLHGLQITDMSAFEELDSLGGLHLSSNDLESLAGLEGLTHLEWVDLTSHSELRDLTGLDNVTEVSGDLQIGICEGEPTPAGWAMESLHGLEALESVGGRFDLGGADRVLDLTGLDSLETVGGDLRLCVNDALSSLDGAPKLKSARFGMIWANAELPTCVAQEFVMGIDFEFEPEIFDNKPDACSG